jgi:structural maintenance of chromosome 1
LFYWSFWLHAEFCHRLEFNREALKTTTDRLTTLRGIVSAEEDNLNNLQSRKEQILKEISEAEAGIEELNEELAGLKETLDEKTKAVDQVKRTTSKAAKALENALKEIGSMVRSDCSFSL